MNQNRDSEIDRDVLNISQIATRLGISKPRCYELVRERQLPHIHLGNRVLVPKQAYLLWLEERAEEALKSVGTTATGK